MRGYKCWNSKYFFLCCSYVALHEAMPPNVSYGREPNASLVAARSACCLRLRCADLYHRRDTGVRTSYNGMNPLYNN